MALFIYSTVLIRLKIQRTEKLGTLLTLGRAQSHDTDGLPTATQGQGYQAPDHACLT